MIDFSKIKDIITVLPLLIIYILPGYVFISIKNFIANKKQVEDKNIILISIVISYIIINFEMLLMHLVNLSIDISSPESIIITFLFSVVIAYSYSMLVDCELIKKALRKLRITRSLRTDTLTEIADFQLGMWVRVFLNSEQVIYIGKLRKFEQIADSNYHVVLSNFILCGYSGEEFLNNEKLDTEWVAVSVKDNYRIELVYDPKSKKIIG
jgi:hypothetical protein